MRSVAAIAIAVVIGGSVLRAAPPAPAVAPSQGTGPSEQPVPSLPRVLVLPFEELSDPPKREWVGKAIQQSLVAELTRGGLVTVVSPAADAKPVKDAAAAAQAARDAHAPLVITGSYQLVDQDLRVTGQMLEAINGEPVAGMKATGNLRDLFGIEDVLGAQVKRDLQAILQPQPATRPVAQPLAQQPGAPGDPFATGAGGVRKPPALGAYDGSELQRSLHQDDTPPPAPAPDLRYAAERYRYGYPGYAHPPYGYYDYCGYDYGSYWPIIVRPVVPAGPSGSTKLPPNNNYAIHPPHTMQGVPGQQMNRSLGSGSSTNNNFNTSPGQSGRSSGGNSVGSPGQSSRSSGGSSMGSPGQSGRSSGGNTMRNASSR